MKTLVIGCPKTIDGDLKCKEVPTSFGFDTACKVGEAVQPLCTAHIFNAKFILDFEESTIDSHSFYGWQKSVFWVKMR